MKNKEQNPTQDEPFAPPQPAVTSTRITPLEIQQKEFRYARFGGYKMRDVDEFLDRVTESMSALAAENERLRSGGATEAPVLGTSDLDDVNRQADEIIQRARDEASRILADARSRSGAMAGAAVAGAVSDEDRAAISAFLSREKEFLQRLAGIVQEHAGDVKEMARSARTPSAPAASGPAPAASAPVATPASAPPAPTTEPAKAPVPPPAAEPATKAKADATISLPRAEEPVRAEQPATAGARRDAGDDPAGGGGDGSLRELFWGEE
jgi:DivIVA domain-containing protein